MAKSRTKPSVAAPRRARSRRTRFHLLFTCVGRRIEMAEAFRRAARALGLPLTIHGADVNWTAPAMHRVDRAHIVPRISHPRHIASLLNLARDERIDAVVPLIDSDLSALARAVPRFAPLDCEVIISSPDVIHACRDKLRTCRVLTRAGIDTPATWSWAQTLRRKRLRFPCFLKPREGSAGKGLYRVNNRDELRILGRRVSDPVVQEYVEGAEHTLDVYTGLDGEPRCVVPRKRLEVRTGEVSKGVIVKDPRIIEVGTRVVRALGSCRGVVTVQCIVTPEGRVRVIEINPRFGGGAPLSIAAGADFPKWLLAELTGRSPRINYYGYTDGLTMLRYDQSVFATAAELNGRSAGSTRSSSRRVRAKR